MKNSPVSAPGARSIKRHWLGTAACRFLLQKMEGRKLIQYANFARTVFSQPCTGPLFLPQLYLESNGTKAYVKLFLEISGEKGQNSL
ncbi:hypothetical protein DWY22_01935 [Heyndrickxia coagulans]|nr:hypothetical protein DWY22_01935 [Heyndrickxia coagulans]RGS00421.1 hypothetical protein DWY16_02225 [Heyndrickxia coagulans]